MMPASDSTCSSSAITPTLSSRVMRLPSSNVICSPGLLQRTWSPPQILSRSKICDGRPKLELHVVGDVHQRRYATLAAAGQALAHPLRRGGMRVQMAHDA